MSLLPLLSLSNHVHYLRSTDSWAPSSGRRLRANTGDFTALRAELYNKYNVSGKLFFQAGCFSLPGRCRSVRHIRLTSTFSSVLFPLSVSVCLSFPGQKAPSIFIPESSCRVSPQPSARQHLSVCLSEHSAHWAPRELKKGSFFMLVGPGRSVLGPCLVQTAFLQHHVWPVDGLVTGGSCDLLPPQFWIAR